MIPQILTTMRPMVDIPPVLTVSALSHYTEWIAAVPEHGATVCVDKEQHWTSFDVVAKLRGITRTKKIGHAGTLDPLATGLLIVCLGKATKTIDHFQGLPKTYDAVIKLGATTKTDDAEAEEENQRESSHITREMVEHTLGKFIGDIEQIPPMYSAIKKNGVPLYKLARKGQEVERQPRKVHIHDIVLTGISLPYVHLTIHCSKGTYIRSLARDMGEQLGCGGYLASLRRTAIGSFTVETAVTIGDIQQAAHVHKA